MSLKKKLEELKQKANVSDMVDKMKGMINPDQVSDEVVKKSVGKTDTMEAFDNKVDDLTAKFQTFITSVEDQLTAFKQELNDLKKFNRKIIQKHIDSGMELPPTVKKMDEDKLDEDE